MEDVLYIVIPAYNESETISQVVESWYEVIKKYNGNGKSKLVIINDGSKDDTYNIANNLKKQYPQLEVIDKKNTGHGATVLYGYNYSLSNNPDFIFQTDSDGQTDPKEFEVFWENRNDYDMVIGFRKYRKDGLSRIIVTKVLKLVLLLCFKVNVLDANTPFRLINKNILEKYIEYIPKDYNLSNILLTVILTKSKCKIKYIPITFRQRQGGINSINIKKIFSIGIKAIKDFITIEKNIF